MLSYLSLNRTRAQIRKFEKKTDSSPSTWTSSSKLAIRPFDKSYKIFRRPSLSFLRRPARTSSSSALIRISRTDDLFPRLPFPCVQNCFLGAISHPTASKIEQFEVTLRSGEPVRPSASPVSDLTHR